MSLTGGMQSICDPNKVFHSSTCEKNGCSSVTPSLLLQLPRIFSVKGLRKMAELSPMWEFTEYILVCVYIKALNYLASSTYHIILCTICLLVFFKIYINLHSNKSSNILTTELLLPLSQVSVLDELSVISIAVV